MRRAVAQTAEAFGGIDICVNNASAISLTPIDKTEPKRFDLMFQINTRGTFVTTQACLPFLRKAENPHVLMLSPPLDMRAKWFAGHVAYSIAKYGMSLCVLGLAEELKADGIAVNALWPRTTIATAAIRNILGGEKLMRMSRKPRSWRMPPTSSSCSRRRTSPGDSSSTTRSSTKRGASPTSRPTAWTPPRRSPPISSCLTTARRRPA